MKLELNKYDRICFFGDSITANGKWIREIWEHFLKNHSELRIGMYNCGISGSKGREANIKDRMYCECLNLFPKYVVVMFGMNDVGIDLYTNANGQEIENVHLKEYEDALENIISLCQKSGAVPVICSPTPYDEYSVSDTMNYFADVGLRQCRDIAEKTAVKYGLMFIDMYNGVKEHFDCNPISEDRVHPNDVGQHIMADVFLKAIGEKQEVLPIEVVEISEKNQQRFEVEQMLRLLMFVERNVMLWQHGKSLPAEEKKAAVKEKMSQPDCIYKALYGQYLENIDYLDEIRSQYVKKTLEMYD